MMRRRLQIRNTRLTWAASAKHGRRRTRLALATLIALAPIAFAGNPAFAAGDNVIDLSQEIPGGTDWSRTDSIITVHDTNGDGVANVVIKGVSAKGLRIVVGENQLAKIELDNATIDLAAAGMRGANHGIALTAGSKAEVILKDGTINTLIGAYSNGPSGGAGIYVPENSELTISGGTEGTGSLTATGWVAMAGIGGGRDQVTGAIIINGGVITATAGDSAAGIGSGYRGYQGPITINGGTITAQGGNGVVGRNGGAGIGCGHGGSPGPIVITGGTVTANGIHSGAGIGAGHQPRPTSKGVNIVITGGTITANGTGNATGIGGATMSGGSAKGTHQIVITGADTNVTATSGRPQDADGKTAVAAIGSAESEGTRTQSLFVVGGDFILNGEQQPKNLKLEVESGNTGAIAMSVPTDFKSVEDNMVRIVRTLDPVKELTFQTTETGNNITFTTNGFGANPDTVKDDQLAAGNNTINFSPNAIAVDLADTAVDHGFWDGQSPILLGYLGFGLALAVITLLIGGFSAWRHMARYRAV
jgi:hypothetical protein